MILKALGLVVDNDVSTERAREADILGRDRRENASSLRLGKLNCEMTDSTRSSMDENGLPGLEPAVSEQTLPGTGLTLAALTLTRTWPASGRENSI
jgi:hypothetical protein